MRFEENTNFSMKCQCTTILLRSAICRSLGLYAQIWIGAPFVSHVGCLLTE